MALVAIINKSGAETAHVLRTLTTIGLSDAGRMPGRAPRSNPTYSHQRPLASGHVRCNPGLGNIVDVSVSKARCATIDLDDRLVHWRSSITGIENELESLESVIGAFEVYGIIGTVAEILMKALLYIHEVPGGFESAYEPRSISCPKKEAAINDVCVAQLPAERGMRASLGDIEAEKRDSPLRELPQPML
jgi:hypothetical protein